MAGFQDLVRDLATPQGGDRWTFLLGKVAVVNAGPPASVDVAVGGGTVPALRYPQGTTPAVDGAVWVACKDGAALFVAFVLA